MNCRLQLKYWGSATGALDTLLLSFKYFTALDPCGTGQTLLSLLCQVMAELQHTGCSSSSEAAQSVLWRRLQQSLQESTGHLTKAEPSCRCCARPWRSRRRRAGTGCS